MPLQKMMLSTVAIGGALLLAGCGERPAPESKSKNADDPTKPSVLDEPVTEQNMEQQLDALEKQINAPIEP